MAFCTEPVFQLKNPICEDTPVLRAHGFFRSYGPVRSALPVMTVKPISPPWRATPLHPAWQAQHFAVLSGQMDVFLPKGAHPSPEHARLHGPTDSGFHYSISRSGERLMTPHGHSSRNYHPTPSSSEIFSLALHSFCPFTFLR